MCVARQILRTSIENVALPKSMTSIIKDDNDFSLVPRRVNQILVASAACPVSHYGGN